MKKKLTMFTAAIAMAVALAGCSKGGQNTSVPQSESAQTGQVESQSAQADLAGSEGKDVSGSTEDGENKQDAADGESTEDSAGTGSGSSGTTDMPSEAADNTPWTPLIEGYDAEHFPIIDGSTANHPLLAAIYERLCGVDRETAETMVPFNTNSTGSIWWQMLYDSQIPYDNMPALYVVYEPPVEIKESEAERFDSYEIDPLGRDGLVFMVNKENPVESLTVEQLYDIYTGKITNWKEVGGNDEEILPFQRNEDSGSQTLFMKLLMNQEQPMEPPTDLKVDTMGGLIDSVAAFDGSGSAIGFSVYYYANLMHANPSLKLIAVNGVEPSNESIESAQYPLTNDFYVAIRAAEPEDSPVRALRDWLLTDEGKQLLEKENYVWARQGLPAETHGTENPFK